MNQEYTHMTQSNPLGQFFRKPGLNVRLPSGGKFYKVPPKVTIDGEIAVFPMTAKDELLIKNADSLLNGDAIVSLIKSCVPDIDDPREMPNPDLDAILLAIRKATYGDKIEVTATCPCEEWKGTYSISVDNLLMQVNDIDDFNQVELDNQLIVNLKPSTLHDQNKLGLTQFENVRKLQAAENINDERVKIAANNEVVSRNILLTQDIIANGVVNVALPDGNVVADPAQIREWIGQLEVNDFKKIEDKLGMINKSGMATKTSVGCGKEGCERKFDLDFTLDPVSFFAPGS